MELARDRRQHENQHEEVEGVERPSEEARQQGMRRLEPRDHSRACGTGLLWGDRGRHEGSFVPEPLCPR
jgi:hypothetical protein